MRHLMNKLFGSGQDDSISFSEQFREDFRNKGMKNFDKDYNEDDVYLVDDDE